DAEWIIHAATNDLPCLAEVRFLPARLFDTELAARLLGFERVNLSALMEHFLGVGLAKKFSAEDWSARPLPRSWRTYAALDVERLADLRDALAAELEAAGRLDIALQEFAHLAAHAADPPAVHPDPWRRTANIHLVHTQRGLAVVRELWLTRDAIARRTDTAPSKILVDKGITELAAQLERAKKVAAGDLLKLPAFARKGAKPYLKDWADAANRALALPDSQLPTRSRGKEPHAQQWRWKKSFPQLAARYDRVREEVSALAERTRIPVVQLLEPDLLRRVLWETKDGGPADAVALLAQLDARHWQIELVAPILAAHWR
ncbi:MAG: HRDC domain-containing protein, partial [Propionibacteriaceae bacterium]|nr:HRDC domain-containing protein [Propionibacteriaceae bacterium]